MTGEAKTLITIAAATLVILFGGIFFLTKPSTPQVPQKVNEALLVREDSNKIVTDGAKVTIVEFGDFQCPACGAAHPVIEQILQDNKDQVNFVFRNFPLSNIHANAIVSALAAEAAGEQGKYWEMHHKIYDTQDKWSESKTAIDIFVDYAKELNLDVDKFKKAIEENKFKDKIEKDFADGQTIGVNVTPTFFVNGEKMEGFGDLLNKVNLEIQKK